MTTAEKISISKTLHGMTNTGYKRVYVAGKGRMLEHRLVMERHIGRKLTSTECVHHKDENKTNNSIDNLEILSRSEHKKLHVSNGFDLPQTKLSMDKILEIRDKYNSGGITQKQLGYEYGCRQDHISRIINNKSRTK